MYKTLEMNGIRFKGLGERNLIIGEPQTLNKLSSSLLDIEHNLCNNVYAPVVSKFMKTFFSQNASQSIATTQNVLVMSYYRRNEIYYVREVKGKLKATKIFTKEKYDKYFEILDAGEVFINMRKDFK